MNAIETVVVGGGPAGAAAACALAAAGREVALLERSGAAHHKVCGEFISIETQNALARLGIDLDALAAVAIDGVTIHWNRFTTGTALPFRAVSLSRYRLDHALLERAVANGAQVSRGIAVQAVTREERGWTVRCDDGRVMRARQLVLATGKTGLRGIAENRDGSLVGLKMHLWLRDATPFANKVALFMLDHSYVGLELVEGGIANLCLVMSRQRAGQIGAGWQALHDHLVTAQPQLAAAIAGAEPLFDKPLAVVCPSGGHFEDHFAPAVFRVGDRLAHIPPFTGDGLAIAVTSGILAAEHIMCGRSPTEYVATMRGVAARQIRLAGLLSRAAAYRTGRALIFGAAGLVPGLIGGVALRTRMPALPMQGQDVSYAPVDRRFSVSI